MKRYGDNITQEDVSEEPTRKGLSDSWLFLGGCGATFGAFPPPDGTADLESVGPKDAFLELLSFLNPRKAQKSR